MSALWQDDWYGVLGDTPVLSDEDCDILEYLDAWETQFQCVSCAQVWQESLYDETEVVLATRWRSTKKKEKTIWDSLEYSPSTSGAAYRSRKTKADLKRKGGTYYNHGVSNIIPFPEPATYILSLTQFAKFYAHRSLIAGRPLKPEQFREDALLPNYLPSRRDGSGEEYTFEEVVLQALKEDPEFRRCFEVIIPEILQEVAEQAEKRKHEMEARKREEEERRRQEEAYWRAYWEDRRQQEARRKAEEARRREEQLRQQELEAQRRAAWRHQQEEARRAEQIRQQQELEEAKQRAYKKAQEAREEARATAQKANAATAAHPPVMETGLFTHIFDMMEDLFRKIFS